MARDKGWPAFPFTEFYDEKPIGAHAGMSLRDWFAGHAPRTPHSWFRPTMATEEPKFRFHEGHNEGIGCSYDGLSCTPLNRDEFDAWHREHQRQLFLQWPYAYADAMLTERGK
jgi:hypothetical protein